MSQLVSEGTVKDINGADYIGDISCDDEDQLEKEIEKSEIIIGDPLFKPICHGRKFIEIPHDAFSGRCFKKYEKNMIAAELPFLDELKKMSEE